VYRTCGEELVAGIRRPNTIPGHAGMRRLG
jgi:hypothetical protein